MLGYFHIQIKFNLSLLLLIPSLSVLAHMFRPEALSNTGKSMQHFLKSIVILLFIFCQHCCCKYCCYCFCCCCDIMRFEVDLLDSKCKQSQAQTEKHLTTNNLNTRKTYTQRNTHIFTYSHLKSRQNINNLWNLLNWPRGAHCCCFCARCQEALKKPLSRWQTQVKPGKAVLVGRGKHFSHSQQNL